jgi:hypothetical protein
VTSHLVGKSPVELEKAGTNFVKCVSGQLGASQALKNALSVCCLSAFGLDGGLGALGSLSVGTRFAQNMQDCD